MVAERGDTSANGNGTASSRGRGGEYVNVVVSTRCDDKKRYKECKIACKSHNIKKNYHISLSTIVVGYKTYDSTT